MTTMHERNIFDPRSSASSARRGQLLVECLIAVSLLTVGFLGLFALLNRSLSLNRLIADNYVATYLSAEGIEVARNIFDANTIQKLPWNSGFLPSGDYEVEYNSNSLVSNQNRFLMFDPATHLYSYNGTRQTNFKRLIRVSVGTNEIKVNSLVSWTTLGGGSFQVNLEDHFMNSRP